MIGDPEVTMKRREAFMVLGLAGVGTLLPAAPVDGAPADASSGEMTDQHAEILLRYLARVEPRPGEAARVREALNSAPPVADTDPRIQPALAFHPEVEA